MEEHFLKDHVTGMQRSTAPHEPWYNPDGDCIVYQTQDEAVVADRIDESLTIYRSALDGKAIGFQIKGVAAIIGRFGLYGIGVKWSESEKEVTSVSLYSLLLAAYDRGPRTIGRRQGYTSAFQSASSDPRVMLNDLPALFPQAPPSTNEN